MLWKTWSRLLKITRTQEGITITMKSWMVHIGKEALHRLIPPLNSLPQTWQSLFNMEFQIMLSKKMLIDWFHSTNLCCAPLVEPGRPSIEAPSAWTPTESIPSCNLRWRQLSYRRLIEGLDLSSIPTTGARHLCPLVTESGWPKSLSDGQLLGSILHRETCPTRLTLYPLPPVINWIASLPSPLPVHMLKPQPPMWL